MRKLSTILTAALLAMGVTGQAPQKLSYQAVVRDNNNQLVTSRTIVMQISILQGAEDGTAVYVETHMPQTNANGLVSIEIGGGFAESGNFTTINWAAGPYFMKTEIDPEGGTSYTITGTSQLLSVPYALHARTAQNATVTVSVSATGDTLHLGPGQWVIVPGISEANAGDSGNGDTGTGTFTDDRDGNTYRYVTIGDQVWMAENLKYLPEVTSSDVFDNDVPRYYVFAYNGNDVAEAKATGNYGTYGVLYNWSAAVEACPAGWHLPGDGEWTELTDHLGGETVAGGQLKEAGTNHWQSPNTGATNESGFTALPGGFVALTGNMDGLGESGIWWTSTESELEDIDYLVAWSRGMSHDSESVNRSNQGLRYFGFSVRCLRD
jgi:uncharacterized protein (TIGR02145 family)